MNLKIPVKWQCPVCTKKHYWKWPHYDVMQGKIKMLCENCGEKTSGIMDCLGEFTPNVRDHLSLPVARSVPVERSGTSTERDADPCICQWAAGAEK